MRRRLTLGPVLAGTVLVAGCSGGVVEVPPPDPDERAAQLCQGLMERLPDSLFGEEQVRVEPASRFVAAWGSPTVALRCGVERPAGLQPDSELMVINEIAWLPQPADSPNLYTAVGREAYVEMSIPPSYSPPAEGLTAISDLIVEEIPALPAGTL
ncbi:DUF3515 domain-containing protein [Marinactinospora thermotolerans]|uniref:DUF3515 domain-containing protein n=1 Tax=Marinactinospora thermotolerans DSM 45154 TaxID=1122192 RepID=A0A1T4SF87_9ACTN|nr:DUF3515 domain-containing protein [Marinactinospora thermotolerans]SKA26974.1 Protein of unknown function [Marinactinospora thermotolerans DSM 45154]